MGYFEVGNLNAILDGHLIGNSNLIIKGPEQIEKATENTITFIGSKVYLAKWKDSLASAAIITKDLAGLTEPGQYRAFIVVENVDLAMAKVLELFNPEGVKLKKGVHESACVQPSARISADTIIGAHCYIGDGVFVGKNVVVYPNVTILDDAIIGDNTVIRSGTVISERCVIGNNCILHANITIGTDGFGYRPSPDGKGVVKIPHIGNVVIGNGVEIGAGTCIDRGKFGSTTIGDGTKIDNLVQIGHNCTIGRSCLIAGCCGISGSVTLGDGVIMAGQAAIADHIVIGNRVTIGAKSGVMRDIPDGKTVLGYPAADAMKTLRGWAALSKLSEEKKR
jgi:UDP-3-O-[3-hydroxymyristoyl] glucosamine N-acyltransferase